MYLPDINVWLALAFPSHMHHHAARTWFTTSPADRPCHFCRYTPAGFLRLANNLRVFPQSAVTQDQAWILYDAIRSNPRVDFAIDPPGAGNVVAAIHPIPAVLAERLERRVFGRVQFSRQLRVGHVRQGLRPLSRIEAHTPAVRVPRPVADLRWSPAAPKENRVGGSDAFTCLEVPQMLAFFPLSPAPLPLSATERGRGRKRNSVN